MTTLLLLALLLPEHGGKHLMDLAQKGVVTNHPPATNLVGVIAPASIMPPTNFPALRVVRQIGGPVAALPPTPKTRVWTWELPGWQAQDILWLKRGPTWTTNYFAATWLERVTVLGATNWSQCSSNVPVTSNTRFVSAVVTNDTPAGFLRANYGWRKE